MNSRCGCFPVQPQLANLVGVQARWRCCVGYRDSGESFYQHNPIRLATGSLAMTVASQSSRVGCRAASAIFRLGYRVVIPGVYQTTLNRADHSPHNGCASTVTLPVRPEQRLLYPLSLCRRPCLASDRGDVVPRSAAGRLIGMGREEVRRPTHLSRCFKSRCQLDQRAFVPGSAHEGDADREAVDIPGWNRDERIAGTGCRR